MTDARICILGASRAGKTCFHAGLSVLAQPDRPSSFQIFGSNPESHKYIDGIGESLSGGQFPTPTNTYQAIDFTIVFRENKFHVKTLDYPGEDFQKALKCLDTRESALLMDEMSNADFVLLLLSPDADLGLVQRGDGDSRRKRLTALLNGIFSVFNHPEARAKKPRIAFVITKSDLLTEPAFQALDPAALIDHSIPNLAKKIQIWAGDIKCFIVSSAGQVTFDRERGVSCPVQGASPTGYEPIFDWILACRKADHIKSLPGANPRIFIGLVILVFLLTAVWLSSNARNRLLLQEHQKITTALIQIEDRLGEIRSPQEAEDELKNLERLAESVVRLDRKAEYDIVRYKANERCRELMFQNLNALPDTVPLEDFERIAGPFIQRFGSTEEGKKIILLHRSKVSRQQQEKRTKIFLLPYNTTDAIQRKIEAIGHYITQYKNDPQIAGIERARDLAMSLSTKGDWPVELQDAGTFVNACEFSIKVFIGSVEKPVLDTSSEGAKTFATWTGKKFLARWKPGEEIRIELWADGYTRFSSGSRAAMISDKSFLSIRLLTEKTALAYIDDDFKSKVDLPYARFKTDGLDSTSIQLVKDWVGPGEKWNNPLQ
ncbi:MAG: hypothetical protein HQM09_02135 [Candidatus Riflebacteria bacterium]|nr:hypothetical protein [Candidatus Riflebacteria bacterium]